MLTITDFINVLRKYYKSPAGINQELEEQKIVSWKGESEFFAVVSFLYVIVCSF